MNKITLVSGKKMIKILESIGFSLVRIKGSHCFLYNRETKKSTTVPIHGNEIIGIGLLRTILNDCNIPVNEYEKLRSKV